MAAGIEVGDLSGCGAKLFLAPSDLQSSTTVLTIPVRKRLRLAQVLVRQSRLNVMVMVVSTSLIWPLSLNGR